MSFEYTTMEDWKEYWNKKNIREIKKLFFNPELLELQEGKSILEIGGFPGNIAAYLIKNYNVNAKIIDFVDFPKVIERVREIYKIKGELEQITGNLFEIKLDKKFDVVCSFGLIEHFEDTKAIMNKHFEFVKSAGIILCTMPNFKGINGWVQKIFDSDNYKKHNIDCMDINFLDKILRNIDCASYKIFYYGKPTIWLETKNDKKNIYLKYIFRQINRIIKYIPFTNRFVSPHIVIKAYK